MNSTPHPFDRQTEAQIKASLPMTDLLNKVSHDLWVNFRMPPDLDRAVIPPGKLAALNPKIILRK